MESNSAWPRIRAQLNAAFQKWGRVFLIAFLLTLIVHVFLLSKHNICSAVVHFNYPGIESGNDPNGNRFDVSEIKDAEVVRTAAEAMERAVTEEDVERIQDAIDIMGSISGTVFKDITENVSIFGEDEIPEVTEVRQGSYFPDQYTVKFHYAEAGFSSKDAARYLTELLNAYEWYFYDKYGYHTSFEQSLADIDYNVYDYIDAIDVLNSHLTTLRAYLTRLSGLDHTRFVSSETGYSIPDLVDTIDTIRNENVQWTTSYIISNNMTKDREKLIDYYLYKIEDAQRSLAQQDARLFTLNELIDSYVKTNAVFPIIGDSGNDQEEDASLFEFSQPAQMYNSLINQKVSCQTSMSETQEQIAMLNRRIERLQAAEGSTGNPEMVEAQLRDIDGKINRLLSDIQRTSDEFFKSDWLEYAFQILKEPKSKALSIGLKSTVLDILIVEVLLVGLCIFSALRTSGDSRRRTARKARLRSAEDQTEDETTVSS
ncbi:MAG: hypothetical protein IJR54_08365 [Oscillibacter sp.]|nr:hypothetical protein [Oscillibacter sp.]